MNKAKLNIQNLRCGGCKKTILTEMGKISGVHDVEVQLEDDLIEFNYSDEVTVQAAILRLDQLGYPVRGRANSLGKKMKSLASCAIGKIK